MLNAGFIGFGRMGITHFSILNTHPSVKITSICDQSSTMLKILGTYLDIATYTDYKEMVDKEELDFVVISTPSHSHAEIIKYALDRDLHVFTEKPLALTKKEGQEILDKLNGKSLVNQVGYVNRFNEVFMKVKNLLDSGIIGEVKTFRSEMYGATILRDAKDNWRGKKDAGGGCLYEFASHCVDLALYLMGKPDVVTGSVMQSVYSSRVEDIVLSTFIYDTGFSGTIISNWSDESFRKPTNIISIFGTRGRIVADKHSYKIYLRDDIPNEDGFHKGWNTRYITDFAKPVRFYVRGNEFTRQLDYFVECILKEKQGDICSFNDAYQTDSILEEIRRDAESEHKLVPPIESSFVAGRGSDISRDSSWKKALCFWRKGNAS